MMANYNFAQKYNEEEIIEMAKNDNLFIVELSSVKDPEEKEYLKEKVRKTKEKLKNQPKKVRITPGNIEEIIKYIYKEENLALFEKYFLVLVILELKGKSGELSLRKLSKEYKMDRSTIIRRIKDLEEKGYIRRMSTFRGTYLSLEFLNEEAENYLKEETKVEKEKIFNSEFINNEKDEKPENTSKQKTDYIQMGKEIKRKEILKTIMLIPGFNDPSRFSREFLKIVLDEEKKEDNLALLIYSSEKSNKNPVSYFLQTYKNDGSKTIENAYRQKAVERIEFTEEFFKINFQEPSLKELKQIANKIGENYEGDRKDLMKRLEERRNFVNQQAHEVVKNHI